MLIRALWLALFAVLPAPTLAAADDGMALLQRIAQASRHLTYSGTFVYRNGNRVETSRIAHSASNGRELERIEVMDGSPREILRDGDEVRCFLPEEQLVIIENRARQRNFPALLPTGLGSLPEHYTISAGAKGRVAGIDSRIVRLEPKDALRYGHELWMDAASGLLLKAAMLGERGEPLESFTFTQVSVGGPLARDALKPRFNSDKLRVQQVRASVIRPEDLGWSFRTALPGFRKISAMKREGGGEGHPESLHVVFSDGMASISVFIESGGAEGEAEAISSVGPINVYRRQLGDHRLVVMGEVPAQAVKRIGDGIERRRK